MALRVSAAVLAAGLIANGLGVKRSYWAMAAAAAILGLGSYAAISVDRGLHRVVGSLMGAVLGIGLLAFSPLGAVLVLVLTLLLFGNEVVATRNCALGMLFMASFVLLLSATGSHGAGRVGLPLMWLEETGIACACALATGRAVSRRWATKHVRIAARETALAIEGVLVAPEDDRQQAEGMLLFRLQRLERVTQRTFQERQGVRDAVRPYRAYLDAADRLGKSVVTRSQKGELGKQEATTTALVVADLLQAVGDRDIQAMVSLDIDAPLGSMIQTEDATYS
jgi:uncharacterized membrane protein YccC